MYMTINFLKNLIMTYPRETTDGGRNYSQMNLKKNEPATEYREKIVQ